MSVLEVTQRSLFHIQTSLRSKKRLGLRQVKIYLFSFSKLEEMWK